jgi:3-phenylpropionate/trans-cinnamate dioxygenase ferredoxin reductase subunit
MIANYGTIVVGAGKAGSQAAVSLREEGYSDAILLVGDETDLPYDRPPLSKAYLVGDEPASALLLRAASFYKDLGIDVELGCSVRAIDPPNKKVVFADGRQAGYNSLVLATGARVRPLPFAGGDLPGVVGLRTIADADVLRDEFERASNVVVIGGGFIGLEAAAVAATTFGCSVTLVEALPQLMSRTGLPETAAYVQRHQNELGVVTLLNTPVSAILVGRDGRVASVVTAGGGVLEADTVVYGIGVIPGVELAEAAGLDVDNGISVDASLQTSVESIWAIGDCASYPSSFADAVVRLESVQNATDQARHVARQIASATPSRYHAVPWFWSDQAGLRIQSAGITGHRDQSVVIGDLDAGAFSVLAFRDGVLIGGDSVRCTADHLALRRLLALESSGLRSLTPEMCAADGFSLREFAKSTGQAAPRSTSAVAQ